MNSRSLEDRPVGLVGALPTCPREIPPGFGLKVALKRFRSTRSYTCSRTVSINLSGWSQQQITGLDRSTCAERVEANRAICFSCAA